MRAFRLIAERDPERPPFLGEFLGDVDVPPPEGRVVLRAQLGSESVELPSDAARSCPPLGLFDFFIARPQRLNNFNLPDFSNICFRLSLTALPVAMCLADLERDAAGNGVPRRRARGVSVEYDAAALLLGYSRKTTQDLPDAKETKGPRPNTHAGPGAHYGSGEYKFSESQGASSGPGAAAASISHIVQKRLRYDKNLAEQARQEAAEADRAKWEAREREMKGGDQEGEEEEEEAHGLLGGPPRRMGQRRRSYRESRVNEEDREAYHDYEVQKGIYTEGSAARALALPSHDVRDWIAKDPQLAAGKRQSDRIVAARAEGYVHPEKQFHKDAITREMDEVRFQ